MGIGPGVPKQNGESRKMHDSKVTSMHYGTIHLGVIIRKREAKAFT
jgi:hypothetical protein